MNHTVEITNDAVQVMQRMWNRVSAIGDGYGYRSEEYMQAAQSLSRSLVAMHGLKPARITADGELSLYCIGNIHFGVNWHQYGLSDDFKKRFPEWDMLPKEFVDMVGRWSVNS